MIHICTDFSNRQIPNEYEVSIFEEEIFKFQEFLVFFKCTKYIPPI